MLIDLIVLAGGCGGADILFKGQTREDYHRDGNKSFLRHMSNISVIVGNISYKNFNEANRDVIESYCIIGYTVNCFQHVQLNNNRCER